MQFFRRRSAESRTSSRGILALLDAAGSLHLAVVLIGVYAAVLAWATLAESRYGAAAAHFGVYDTGWFAALNALLALNVFCAVVVRLPWRRRLAGFFVTHGGILVLLLGCLATRQLGIEAQLPIYEGKAAHIAYQEAYHFELRPNDGEKTALPFIPGPFSWSQYAELSWFPWHWAYRSCGVVYDQNGIVLEVLDYTKEPTSSTRVRLSVDGKSKEFDLVATIEDAEGDEKKQVVECGDRHASVVLRQDEVALGFQVFLHQFVRKLDPGGGMASHYSSRVDFLDLNNPPQKLAEDVTINLNAPADFADPSSGKTYRLFQLSFRGPWTPGEPEFDQLTKNDNTRDILYLSQLSVNCDPGRSLKYIGSAMIVSGIVLVYYFRKGKSKRH